MNLREIVIRPVPAGEEDRFQQLIWVHRFLGTLPKIGQTLEYVATWRGGRLVRDCRERFGYPLLLLETMVDPHHFHGTFYRAANGRHGG